MIQLKDLIPNPDNPRYIHKDEFEKLKRSITQDPDFMDLNPIVYDENMIILGGNMRHKALIAMGYTEIDDKWGEQVSGWSDEKKKRFLIKDNAHFGQWDMELLANEWDQDELDEWGLTVVFPEKEEDPPPPGEPKQIDVCCPKCDHKFNIDGNGIIIPKS